MQNRERQYLSLSLNRIDMNVCDSCDTKSLNNPNIMISIFFLNKVYQITSLVYIYMY